MPLRIQLDNLRHCLVGLDAALRISFSRSISIKAVSLEISSAVFSALLLVGAKTMACLPIFMVSRARLMISSGILISLKHSKNTYYNALLGLIENNWIIFLNGSLKIAQSLKCTLKLMAQ